MWIGGCSRLLNSLHSPDEAAQIYAARALARFKAWIIDRVHLAEVFLLPGLKCLTFGELQTHFGY